MANYDFSHLSSYEFELLCRDLLQKEFAIRLESFKSGKDGGIDLRHCTDLQQTLIVQCKRFVESDFNQLVRELQTEAKKVEKMQPTRYVICTALGLLPQQKTKILQMFKPYCHSTADILGREDLNNLLGIYPEVEKKHHKLWLHSIEILKSTLHASVLNFSQAELLRVEKKRRLYVHTEGFNAAMEILDNHGYCVITGIPGIGKTTLAEMLILAHAGNDYEVVKVSEDINEAFSFHDANKKQLFYYDDFLGQTSFQTKLGKNEDDRLLAFITLVGNSTNTRFVLTTREYILKQAQSEYERLSKFEFEKCVLEPPKYTDLEKAKMLFNHIFFSNLTDDYKAALLTDFGYLKICYHRSYNPRLISTMTEIKRLKSIPPEIYVKKFLALLENPEEIWRHAYENQISTGSKHLLLLVTTMPSKIFLDDVKAAFQTFHYSILPRYGNQGSSKDFQIALAELEETFLRIDKSGDGTKVIVQFHNPSVRDFMENVLAENFSDVEELIEFAIFFEQLEYLAAPDSSQTIRKKIAEHASQSSYLAGALTQNFESVQNSLFTQWVADQRISTETRLRWSETERLWLLIRCSTSSTDELNQFISRQLFKTHQLILDREVDKQELLTLIKALNPFDLGLIPDQLRETFWLDCQEYLCEELDEFQDFSMVAESISQFSTVWGDDYKNEFRKSFSSFFYDEIPNLPEDSEFEDKISHVEQIASLLNISVDKELKTLRKEREIYLDEQERREFKRKDWVPKSDLQQEMKKEIIQMFEGLV